MSANARAIIVAVIGALGTIIAAAMGLVHFGPDPEKKYLVAVFNNVGREPIPDAEISWNIPGLPTERTDSVGKKAFPIRESDINKQVELTIRKPGFVLYKEDIPALQPLDAYHAVYLVPTAATPTLAASAASAATGPASPPNTLPPSTKTVVYRSGMVPSGPGKEYSGWYKICSNDEDGYVIQNVSFVLSGDRVCNAWSECQQLESTPRRVCWQFRLQGHDEWPFPGQGLSEGQLTITWTKA